MPPQQSNGASTGTDDDWDFASALPADNSSLPRSNEITVSKTSVTVVFKISRMDKPEAPISILASYSNNTPSLITEYTFQVAVTKVSPRVLVAFVSFPATLNFRVTEHGLLCDSLVKQRLMQRQSYTLQLTPQSGRTLQPNQANGITQPIEINGVPRGSGNSVKMRWKASYKVGGELKMEQGEVASLGII